jgi:poly(A)-specific ribonuclease
VASKFRIIQFGITLFIKDKEAYKAYPFNAYVIQDEGFRQGYMGLEMSALQFLVSYGMDFNKWIKEGVPYVGKMEEMSLLKNDNEYLGDMIEILDKKYQDETEKEFGFIAKWMADTTNRTPHFIPGANSYIRKYYYQQLKKKYPHCVVDFTQIDKMQGLILYKPFLETEKEEYNSKKSQEIWSKIGFRNVFKAICESHLPVVGHNCFYDFLFLYNSFEEPLPEPLSKYKNALGKLFVEIYDTKLVFTDIAVIEQLKLLIPDTVLESIYALLGKQQNPKIEFGEGFNKYSTVSLSHEAGFDSYMTGFAFLKMQEILKGSIKKYKGLINCYNGIFSFNIQGEDLAKSDIMVVTSNAESVVNLAYTQIEEFKEYATIKINDEGNAIFVLFDQYSTNSKGKELITKEIEKYDVLQILNWKEYSAKRSAKS